MTDETRPVAAPGAAVPAAEAAARVSASAIPESAETPVGLAGEPRDLPTGELLVQWAPAPAQPDEPPRRGVGGLALGASVIALGISLFVGWGFPVGLVGVIAGIVALRRPTESRTVAVWAICLGVLSLVYSGIWIGWAASQGDLFS